MTTQNVLTEQDYIRITDALRQLDEADKQIVLARAAGIDTADTEQKSRETRARLLAVKQVYFPGR